MTKNKKNGFGKFLAGAGIGLAFGMLFSKKNGEENRAILKAKVDELIIKVKSIDSKELIEDVESKVTSIMKEISELDKEKALLIAKKKASEIKAKSEDLVEYAIEKGTPAIEKTAAIVKEKAILVTKEILKKLEQEEK